MTVEFGNLEALAEAMRREWQTSADLYTQLNRLRNWVNASFPDFELYLEDVWNDHVPGETHFEYILRSRKTFNETPAIGYDIYLNHQDASGVWHLDDYVKSVLAYETPDEMFSVLAAFMGENR